MAQHDYIISNQTFPNTRADINNVLSAIASNNSGTSAPTTQYAGQFWIDTTSSTWTLYIHDGSDDIQFATIDTSANTVNFIDSELGDNSVTTSKIADANVTSAKLVYPLTTFSSTGIDDNATSTAITIDSSQQVGIGTASPDGKLHIDGASDTVTGLVFEAGVSGDNKFIDFQNTDGSKRIGFEYTNTNITFNIVNRDGNKMFTIDEAQGGDIYFYEDTGTTPKFFWDASAERLGIGTTSPSHSLQVSDKFGVDTSNSFGRIYLGRPVSPNLSSIVIQGTDVGETTNTLSMINYSGVGASIELDSSASAIKFNVSGTSTERMRINSSGNLLVGKTSDDNATQGIRMVGANGFTSFVRNNDLPVLMHRLTSDGDIIRFDKDNTVIGSIGTVPSAFYISGNNNVGLQFNNATDEIRPCNSDGTGRDNAIDLGNATRRFDDIYATNGTIQTSDQNEKQSIQSLTTAEMNVAKRLSPLIKTFKWNSSVEEKGDSARTHTGIIAQDVQQAFTDEGLDAGNYALFISNTWWEKEISVEATEEKDAYTYMDIKEEATDGYTERTRLGVRYPELLSFIQAYNDQRFTELEARITALETQP